MLGRRTFLALLGVLALAPAAEAQTPASPAASGASPTLPTATGEGTMARPGDAIQQAVAHYERSRGYYATGRYRAAIAELEAAIRLDRDAANLYFDLGLLYERIGVIDRARSAYGHYLLLSRDAGERERTERIMRRLQGAEPELADLRVSSQRGRADAWTWTAVALSGATFAAGVGFAVSAATNASTAARWQLQGLPMSMVEAQSSLAARYYLGAGVLLGAGVGFGVTAALLYGLRFAAPRIIPTCAACASPRWMVLAGPDAVAVRVWY